MTGSQICSRCGAALSAEAPGGHCLQCLLQLGLHPEELPVEEAGQFGVPPSVGPPTEPPKAGTPNAPLTHHASRIKDHHPGDRIGHYKLLQQIGEGGCGIVYMAEQEQPVRRRVALKIIKLGMDTRSVIARFEAERQALAMMDHPNIAKVFDAGSTGIPVAAGILPAVEPGFQPGGMVLDDPRAHGRSQADPGGRMPPSMAGRMPAATLSAGRPYFVMELVRGVKITTYCDQQKLSTRQRLDLFIQVCQAVQHAHQKGIIHRDLKPSNILVTEQDGAPMPKIIDFGIAKATTDQRLTDKTLFTAFEQFVGTPAYMSPEQAGLGGLDIDTRSDIYSLGVLLYELLTGQPPFDSEQFAHSALHEIFRAIREKEPPRPSARLTTLTEQELTTVAQRRQTESAKLPMLLRGDLDWIVMKALEKDRARRYDTASSLARDLRRFLDNETVLARPPGKLYRFQKLIRRNKLTFIAVSAVAGALIISSVVSTWMFIREKAANRRALAGEQQAQIEAARSERETIRAQRAEAEGKEKLWESYLHQARANRWSARVGRRFDSLDVLQKAAEIRPSLKLRNEAIACMALPDLRIARQWDLGGNLDCHWGFDAKGERYVRLDTPAGTLSLRRVQDDVELMSASDCQPPVLGIAFSPNGQYLAVACGTQLPELRVWDLNQKAVILQPGDFPFRCMEFSPDSRLLAVAHKEGNPIVIYDPNLGKTLRTLAQGPLPWAISFDPSGRKLAVSTESDTSVAIRDIETGIVIQSLPHPAPVKGVSWHPGGNFLATACMDNNVYVWDTRTRTIRNTLKGHELPVTNVRFDHEGDLLASDGWDITLRLWDFWAGRQLVSLVGAAADFSADDHWMIGGRSGSRPTIWELAKGRECWTIHCDQENGLGPSSVDFSPDRRLLASAHSDGVRLWDLSRYREIAFLPIGKTYTASFHPDGHSLFTCGQRGLQRWPLAYRQSDQGSKIEIGTAEVFGAGLGAYYSWLSTDGGTWAVVTSTPSDSRLTLYDVATRRERFQLPAQPTVLSVSFSPDGNWLAAAPFGFADLKIWNLRSGALETELPLQDSAHVAFSPDHKWLVSASSREYRFWEVGTWKPAHSIPRRGASDHAGVLAFSAQGKMLAIAEGRNSVRLLHPDTRQELATLEAPVPSEINKLFFNADGSQLAAICMGSHVIQVWDLRLIRRQLAVMKLDWDLPPYPPSPSLRPEPVKVLVPVEPRYPPRDPLTSPRLIDLSPHYNAWLRKVRHQSSYLLTNDFSSLPVGVQTLGGVSFDVRGIIQLLGRELENKKADLPKACRGIRVAQTCQSLHFLHATRYGEKIADGTCIGQYILRYADGLEHVISIDYGEDLRSWWRLPHQPEEASRATIAWRDDNLRGPMRLFKRTIKNPRPEVPVETIDFVSAMSDAAPLLIAITVE